jgi:Mg-chelatase subunit ChlD
MPLWGPCGIGNAIDPVEVDDQNNTLMAYHTTMTELTVPGNHDLLRGDGGNCPSPNQSCPNPGDCESDDLCASWDATTMRYEASQQTLIHGGESDWETLVDNYGDLGLVIPDPLPVAAQPANCDNFLTISNQVDGTDLVVLVIDRSGSMTHQDASPIPGGISEPTRMEFAQAAARVFLEINRTSDMQVGVVSFNEEATVDENLMPLVNSSIGTLRMAIDNLTPGGYTAIGQGMLRGGIELFSATGANPTLFVLSDGENNRGADPRTIAEGLSELDPPVRIFTIPIGNSADRDLLSDVSDASGGIMLDASRGDELPAIYAEMAARHRGSSIVMPQVETQVCYAGTEFCNVSYADTMTFEVATNSSLLNVLISARDPFDSWQPTFDLVSPRGPNLRRNGSRHSHRRCLLQIRAHSCTCCRYMDALHP